ncbi:hypothetical protein ES708_21203 [subsurface metagenome]
MPKLEVILSKEEMADLEEIVQRGEAKDAADALKSMGFRIYHKLKMRADKERKEPSVDLSMKFLQMGFPTTIPCTLARKLRRYKLPYLDFMFGASLLGLKRRGNMLIASREDCNKGAIRYLGQILKGKPKTEKMQLQFLETNELSMTQRSFEERKEANHDIVSKRV